MFNQFHLIGKVNKLSPDNPDYPGVYLELIETKEIIPITFNTEVLQFHLTIVPNNALVAIKGKISIKGTSIVLLAERMTIITHNYKGDKDEC